MSHNHRFDWEMEQIAPIGDTINNMAPVTHVVRDMVNERIPPASSVDTAVDTVIAELVEDLWPQ